MGIGEKTGSEQRADTTRDFVCKRRDTRGPADPPRTMAYVIFAPRPSRPNPPRLVRLSLSALSLTHSFTRYLSLSLSPLDFSVSLVLPFPSRSLFPPPAALYGVSREKRSILGQVIDHCSSMCEHVSKSELCKSRRASRLVNIAQI